LVHVAIIQKEYKNANTLFFVYSALRGWLYCIRRETERGLAPLCLSPCSL
jgi:hypothetical protein